MERKDVIEVTLSLMKEKKLEKTSIGEIVKKLKTSPGTLYYHYKSKNEIYKEIMDYSSNEIIRVLEQVKFTHSKQDYLFSLTRKLIRFLEEKEEILFFLISIKGSYYAEKKPEAEFFLENLKRIILETETRFKCGKYMTLKLGMFLGSIYEILYMSKLVEKRNLTDEEIEEICIYFWMEGQ